MEERIGWVDCLLDEVIIEMKNGSSSKQFNEKIGFPITRIETIWNETIDLNRVKYIVENDTDFIEKYSLKYGDILLSHINSDAHLGKTAIFKNQCKILIHGINLLLLRPSCLINADFLNYQFKFLRIQGKFIEVAQRAVNQSSINQRKLKKFEIILPPLPEQRAIVSKIEQLFSELDNGIANLKLAQEQLKVYRQAVLKKAFEGELTKKWREQQTDLPDTGDLLEQIRVEREESYYQKLEEWKKKVKEWEAKGKEGKKPTKPKKSKENKSLTEAELAKLPKLPEGWKWTIADEILQPNRECAYGVLQPGDDLPEGIPLVRVGDIVNGKVNTSKLKQISSDIANKYKRTFLEGGELLISLVGAIGRTAIAPINIKGANVARAVGVVPISKLLNPYYIEYFFRRSEKIHELTSQAHEVARKTLNLEDVKKATVAICSIDEQQAIVQEIETRLSVCDKIEQDIKENLEKAEALRQSILKKAFEGKLLNEKELAEVRGAEDWEPAEVLLDRVQAEKTINGKKGRA